MLDVLKNTMISFHVRAMLASVFNGQRWIHGMALWSDWALRLIALKPHKRLYFQRVFQALSLMQKAI
ncbi:MAG: hypothetical protein F6K42_21255 [Leptolyngbya sp. SIO1D8]|nr:hypothetical protein [Leptolyngbya sp. SIO1D8]